MHSTSIVFAALLAAVVVLASPTDASALKLKAAAAPHIAAHVAVATDVKAATGNAISKSIVALRAKKAALVSIATAPLRVAANTAAIKVGAAKAVAAAKAAHIARVLNTKQQQNPIVLPVPVPIGAPVQPIRPVVTVKPVPALLPVAPVLPALPVLHNPLAAAAHGKVGHVLNALRLTGH